MQPTQLLMKGKSMTSKNLQTIRKGTNKNEEDEREEDRVKEKEKETKCLNDGRKRNSEKINLSCSQNDQI